MIKKIAIIVGIFVALVIAIHLFLAPNSLLECSDTPSEIKGCQSADAIIAVSGGDTKARAQEAIDLYKNGWAPKIIFSGAAADKSGPSNAAVMRQQALDQGVTSSAILVEDQSEDTKQNAEETSAILRKQNASSAIIVTSNYHAKRTLIEFKRWAPGVEYRVKPATGDNQWSVWWWLTPYGWYLAISEIIKIIISYIGTV